MNQENMLLLLENLWHIEFLYLLYFDYDISNMHPRYENTRYKRNDRTKTNNFWYNIKVIDIYRIAENILGKYVHSELE
jgi:hypothetical protein